MGNLFSDILGGQKKILKDKYINVPITDTMLLKLMNQKPIEGISDLAVSFGEETIVISGKAKKMLVTIPFQVELKPVHAEDRNVYFAVVDMKPLNQGWIKKVAFNIPPTLTYEEEKVCMDLNSIDIVKKVLFGKIKHMEVKENKLYVGIGI
ncbi:hypothetical protein [Ectobacillus sp. sgz5001026]|uniref:hypothetical protein n=1 Tax=Ectobacillus sp. sgz5001026 TaxID=3242473 RepID=UPI0036D3CBF7